MHGERFSAVGHVRIAYEAKKMTFDALDGARLFANRFALWIPLGIPL